MVILVPDFEAKFQRNTVFCFYLGKSRYYVVLSNKYLLNYSLMNAHNLIRIVVDKLILYKDKPISNLRRTGRTN